MSVLDAEALLRDLNPPQQEAVIAVTTPGGAHELSLKSDAVLTVASCADELMPILTAIPLQLLAYHIALLRGCDVDQPRNLAKSVTVE